MWTGTDTDNEADAIEVERAAKVRRLKPRGPKRRRTGDPGAPSLLANPSQYAISASTIAPLGCATGSFALYLAGTKCGQKELNDVH
jgi:hypothetical protein